MTKPLRPGQVAAAKEKLFPPEVFEVVNNLLIARAVGRNQIIIFQDEVVNGITEKLEIPREDVFSKGYLNFEDAYRENGWVVLFDRPGYNETYKSHYIFRPKVEMI